MIFKKGTSVTALFLKVGFSGLSVKVVQAPNLDLISSRRPPSFGKSATQPCQNVVTDTTLT
jgi:hypothetical protein